VVADKDRHIGLGLASLQCCLSQTDGTRLDYARL